MPKQTMQSRLAEESLRMAQDARHRAQRAVLDARAALGHAQAALEKAKEALRDAKRRQGAIIALPVRPYGVRKPPALPTPEGMTIGEFLDQYYKRYVVAEGLRSVASIRRA